jgi:WD40 repeat protein
MLKNTCECPNPPGGRAVCEPYQMAICRVRSGVAVTECLDPPSGSFIGGKDKDLVLVKWALSKITEQDRQVIDDENVNRSRLATLLSGRAYLASSDELVTFNLPEIITVGVWNLIDRQAYPTMRTILMAAGIGLSALGIASSSFEPIVAGLAIGLYGYLLYTQSKGGREARAFRQEFSYHSSFWSFTSYAPVVLLCFATILVAAVLKKAVNEFSSTKSYVHQISEYGAKELGQISGPGSPVRVIAFSPGGRSVATGRSDGTVEVLNALSGQVIAALRDQGQRTPRDGITAIAFFPDGNRVVTGKADGTARIWEVESGKAFIQLLTEGAVKAVAVSPDGSSLITSSTNGIVQLWGIVGDDARELHRLSEDVTQTSTVFSPDGRLIATGSLDGRVRIWDFSSGLPVGPSGNVGYPVTTIVFSPDGRRIFTGGFHGTDVFDTSTTKRIASTAFPYDSDPVVLSSDGRRVVAVGNDGMAEVRDSANGHIVAKFSVGDGVAALAFSPDSELIVVGGRDGTVRMWQVR